MTVTGVNSSQSISFNFDPAFYLPSQTLYSLTPDPKYSRFTFLDLMKTDSCYDGYYYDKDYVKIPLPWYSNPNILYGIAFPQSARELGKVSPRQVYISFGSVRFPLFFPSANVFYQGRTFNGTINPLSPYHELYLPKLNLTFQNGAPAKYASAEIISADPYYFSGYFEMFPLDTSGGLYPSLSIPWTISNSSSCDG
jgi:hypothetical protein